ncbi:inositol monophosphatase family protein [Buchnera aphidicola]|nr:inositol monophosphatase family protein [Buchnera aphidicola]
MHPMLNIAIRIVRTVGVSILQAYDSQSFTQNYQNNNSDSVTHIVIQSEKIMIKMIKKFYPNHKTILVLDKKKKIENNKVYWIINPISGQKNFVKKIPLFCTSINILVNKKIEISVIYDPLHNELFTAVRGQGSKLNGFRTRCIQPKSINNTIFTINNHDIFNLNKNKLYHKLINLLYIDGITFRCTGSLTLNLAYISVGRIDGLIYCHIPFFKLMTGKLNIIESGGLLNHISHNKNENINLNNNLHIFIGSSKLMQDLLKKIKTI